MVWPKYNLGQKSTVKKSCVLVIISAISQQRQYLTADVDKIIASLTLFACFPPSLSGWHSDVESLAK